MNKPAYPKGFLTPEGRPVSIRTMARALAAIRKTPAGLYPGWNWFPTEGRVILAEFRRGLHDRINKRGVTP